MRPRSSIQAARWLAALAGVWGCAIGGFSLLGFEPDSESPAVKFLAILFFAGMIVSVYIGAWYIILHQRELRAPATDTSEHDIDFDALNVASVKSQNPLGTLFLALILIAIALVIMMLSTGVYHPNLFIVLLLLFIGGVFGLRKTGFELPDKKRGQAYREFMKQNNFSYAENNFMMSRNVFSEIDIEVALRSFFPDRIVRPYFEVKGRYKQEDFYLCSFDLTGGSVNISQGEIMLAGTYGLIVLPFAHYRTLNTGDDSIVFTAIVGAKFFVIVVDGIPKDKDGMARTFSLIDTIKARHAAAASR